MNDLKALSDDDLIDGLWEHAADYQNYDDGYNSDKFLEKYDPATYAIELRERLKELREERDILKRGRITEYLGLLKQNYKFEPIKDIKDELARLK